jgi:hypothetical protein
MGKKRAARVRGAAFRLTAPRPILHNEPSNHKTSPPGPMAGSGLTKVLRTRSAASQAAPTGVWPGYAVGATPICDVALREKPRVPHDTSLVALRESGPGWLVLSPGDPDGLEGIVRRPVRRPRTGATAATAGPPSPLRRAAPACQPPSPAAGRHPGGARPLPATRGLGACCPCRRVQVDDLPCARARPGPGRTPVPARPTSAIRPPGPARSPRDPGSRVRRLPVNRRGLLGKE